MLKTATLTTRVLCLLLVFSSAVGRPSVWAASDGITPAALSRQLGFNITVKGVPLDATADIDIFANGLLIQSYRMLPLGVNNYFHNDTFPRYAPLDVRVVIVYTDFKTGRRQRFVDEPIEIPANPRLPATTYGIQYDLTARRPEQVASLP